MDLSQVLCDVQGLALDAGVRLLIVQINVVGDEEDLTNLHQLNGQVQGDGDQNLMGGGQEMETQDRNEPGGERMMGGKKKSQEENRWETAKREDNGGNENGI